MNTISLCEENVKYIGRTLVKESALWLVMSGTGMEFEYTGKKLILTVLGREAAFRENNTENYARLAVYKNGIRIIDYIVDAPQKELTLLDEEVPCTATYKIIKLSECAMSMCGLSVLEGDTTVIHPTSKKPRRLEIIGDSITCGYGIDDENCEHHFKTVTEDFTKAYSYKTAMALNADYSIFATSGHGIISGYTDDIMVRHTEQLIPERYHTFGLCYDTFDKKTLATDVPWDFNIFQPDAIIINLGTNDDSYCRDDSERQNFFKTEYIKFLIDVREKNPTAHIFCVLGLMGKRLYPSICKACEEYTRQTQDTNISTFELPEQDGNIGFVADYHPLEQFHDAAVNALVPFIAKTMDWDYAL